VIDRDVATTTGITGSVPTMLALVEAIGGRGNAERLASELGVPSWTPAHDSARFGLDARRRWSYIFNKATGFWGHQHWVADVHDGSDDIALALAADAWERTSRVSIAAVSPSSRVTLRSGLRLIASPPAPGVPRLPLAPDLKPIQQFHRTLRDIEARCGQSRHEWVLLEMEYPGGASVTPS
jgi:hypothetical protein